MINKSIFVFIMMHAICSCQSIRNKTKEITENKICKKFSRAFNLKSMRSVEIKENIDSYEDFSLEDYCKEYILQDTVQGNLAHGETKWRPSVGSRFKIADFDQSERTVPYVKEVKYAEKNSCNLSIRIFMKNPEEQLVLKPAIFIHGGAWQYRGVTSSIAVDPVIPYFTDKNYVVFSPFYRLLDEKSGPEECQSVTGQEIQDDILDAFNWIKDNLEKFGVDKNSGFTLAGQSAGGHLATFLAMEYPDYTEKVILLYPPLNFRSLLQKTLDGDYPHLKDDETIGKYLFGTGKPPNVNMLDDPLTKKNSFSDRIKSYEKKPVFMMLHGVKDTLVPFEQSVEFCENLGKSKTTSMDIVGGNKITCGDRKSFLYLSSQGKHMMDLRCFTKNLGFLFPMSFLNSILCPSGGEQDSEMTKLYIHDMFEKFL